MRLMRAARLFTHKKMLTICFQYNDIFHTRFTGTIFSVTLSIFGQIEKALITRRLKSNKLNYIYIHTLASFTSAAQKTCYINRIFTKSTSRHS